MGLGTRSARSRTRRFGPCYYPTLGRATLARFLHTMAAPLDDTVAIVLAGGAGERLHPLTKERAKPAVFFGGPYRIIDFALSNCINSGLRRVFIATQYKSLSLNRHIRMGWSIVSEELGEFVEILPPQKRVSEHWYQGTADAVYQNLYSIMDESPRRLIVLAGDHVYKMDYSKMLRFHQETGAAVTMAAIEVPRGRGVALRRRGGGRTGPHHGVPGEAESAHAGSPRAGHRPGVDGHLHLRRGHPGARAGSGRAAADSARLRQEHHPGDDPSRAGLCVPLLRREQEGLEVLARHRDARRVFRRQHGSVPGEPRVQPLRSRVADADVSAAGAAGEVRLRRGRASGAARRSTR